MKLSIIVPVYNLENYVSRTLDSLLTIRFSHDYEIIVVNDGSADGSEAVIRAYQEKTGSAGYTLIYNSHGIQLVEHESFESREQAILSGSDIHNRTLLEDFSRHRIRVRDTDRGKELQQQITNLQHLLAAYQTGIIKEKS